MSNPLLRGLLLRPRNLQRLRWGQTRQATTTDTGAILPRPQRPYKLGPVLVALWAPPFLYAGAMAAKHMAAWMEDMNIFVPDDDDDDD